MLRKIVCISSVLFFTFILTSCTISLSDITKAGCKIGEPKSCFVEGSKVYNEGKINEAVKYMEISCKGGYAKACATLSGLYLTGVPNTYKELCKKGIHEMCLATDLFGDKVIRIPNIPKAYEYAKKSCKENDSDGCNNLGVIYLRKKDYKKAYEYFYKSCELGNGIGCGNLADLYIDAKGVERDLEKAKKYYKKACDLGVKRACEILETLQ